MATVNGCRPSSCGNPSHDSDLLLLGPHGFEGQETMSAKGADGSGGSMAWAHDELPINHRSIISIPSGAQDGNSRSKQPALRTRRSYSRSIRLPRSFLESNVSIHYSDTIIIQYSITSLLIR